MDQRDHVIGFKFYKNTKNAVILTAFFAGKNAEKSCKNAKNQWHIVPIYDIIFWHLVTYERFLEEGIQRKENE